MTSVDVGSQTSKETTRPGVVEMALEVVVIGVEDVDRAKAFYQSLGWRLDADAGQEFRLLQLTPPGSGCSVQFGAQLFPATPGSGPTPYLVVSDIEVARKDLMELGVEVSEIFHEEQPGGRFHDAGRTPGLAADRRSYASFASFSDPDGNRWLIQEVTARRPGRIDPGTTSFASGRDLAEALRRAEKAHAEHEKRIGAADPDWSDWYAKYIAAEQAGTDLPT